MKNVEMKKEKMNELLEELIMEELIMYDYKEVLYDLINNGIVDKRMCQSKHTEILFELLDHEYFVEILANNDEPYVRYEAYKILEDHNQLEQKHIDLAIQRDDKEILLFLIEKGIVEQSMCYSKHKKVLEMLIEKNYFVEFLFSLSKNFEYEDSYQRLIQQNKLTKQHIEAVIKSDYEDALLLLIRNNIVNEQMCYSKHQKVHKRLALDGYYIYFFINSKYFEVKENAYFYLCENNKFTNEHLEKLKVEKELELLQMIQLHCLHKLEKDTQIELNKYIEGTQYKIKNYLELLINKNID